MTASSEIKTPVMDLPLLPHVTEAMALQLCQTLSRMTLSSVIDKVTVAQSLEKVRTISFTFAFSFSVK